MPEQQSNERDRLSRPRHHGLAHGRERRARGLPADASGRTRPARPSAGPPSTARRAVATPAEVAARSDIVVSMVVDGAQVASVLLGEGGVDRGAPARGCCAWTCRRSAPRTRAGSARRCASAACGMLDAPVTGSSPRARGRHADDHGRRRGRGLRARAGRCWRRMGKLIVHVGELGQGEMLKLINNALGAANAAAVAEALLLARATRRRPRRVRRGRPPPGSGASAQLALKSGPMREHDYTTLFKTAHMLKDVRLCLEEAQSAGVPFPVRRPRARSADRDDGPRPRRGGLRGDDRGRRGARGTALVSTLQHAP